MIGVDWGTTSLRCYRIESDGSITGSRQSDHGILAVANEAFSDALESEAGDWIASGESPIVMSGMIGSRQGWKEAAYVPCPAGLADIVAAMKEVEWTDTQQRVRRAYIAPGLVFTDPSGNGDVMRGEETQILGILDKLGPGEHCICLPGTHSKWARVRDGTIVSFSTHMTGEVFGVLKQHSILGRTMRDANFDEDIFMRGVRRSADAGGLLHHIFSVRTGVLLNKLTDSQSATYLSGILIGHELLAAANGIRHMHLMGRQNLTKLYVVAATAMQIDAVLHDESAVTRGLYAFARHLPNGN